MELVVPCVDGSQVTDGEAVVNYMTRIFASIAIAAGFALTAGCANDWTPREIPSPVPPQPTPEPAELSFPDDDSSHDAPIEWWYYNGHLEAEDGSEYSFHFVIFQTNGDTDTTQFEFGQAGITDVQGDSHLKLSSSGFGSFEPSDASLSPGLLGLDLDNFSLDIASDGTHSLRAADASDSIHQHSVENCTAARGDVARRDRLDGLAIRLDVLLLVSKNSSLRCVDVG